MCIFESQFSCNEMLPHIWFNATFRFYNVLHIMWLGDSVYIYVIPHVVLFWSLSLIPLIDYSRGFLHDFLNRHRCWCLFIVMYPAASGFCGTSALVTIPTTTKTSVVYWQWVCFPPWSAGTLGSVGSVSTVESLTLRYGAVTIQDTTFATRAASTPRPTAWIVRCWERPPPGGL